MVFPKLRVPLVYPLNTIVLNKRTPRRKKNIRLGPGFRGLMGFGVACGPEFPGSCTVLAAKGFKVGTWFFPGLVWC